MITSCFEFAAERGNARAIASSAFVESGFPTTCESELSPCNDVATSASPASTAIPHQANVLRGLAAEARASFSVIPIPSSPIVRFGSSGGYRTLPGLCRTTS